MVSRSSYALLIIFLFLQEIFDSYCQGKMKKAKENKKDPVQQPIGPYIELVDENLIGVGLFSDIIYTRDAGHSSWERNYKYFEDEGPWVTVMEIIVDDEMPTS